MPEQGIKVWSKPEFDVCFDRSLYKRPAMADCNKIRSSLLSCYTVLHTVQINFHGVDVNKYRYIQTPIGLLIF